MIISQYEREGNIKICNTVSSLILGVKVLHTTLSLIKTHGSESRGQVK